MEPILLTFPDQFETERLIIRAPKPEDWKPIYTAMQASINELKPWLPFARQEQTEQDVQKTTKEAYLNFLSREDLRFHAFDKETGEFMISSGLHRINWDVRKFEIGYWVDTKHSGKGYVTELVKGLTSFAFRELAANRVEIRCDPKNSRSKTVAERSGFELEGILRNDVIEENGELRDTCIFAVIEDPNIVKK
ncbi:ribosomal-protein-serine acetyltransferase [Oceanobacillus oncorhynchi subsp. incaldanensis]|uniref:GNAT family N-acetyltransferase n=1 Tax=Oceanobacillus oncorhynchi TaxID=545501 RepID=UPI001B1923A6|nr:GNAT family N-acetyltransferase [Oceanobacillus oncorhynchi]GIO18738.1 ribosomal-protein-serine acetyltransferase [Oceanobacillus oncorhynchi subsp. incaldanensis]